MKNLTNQFIHYLVSIGILSADSIEDFYRINCNYSTEPDEESKEEEVECFKESMTMSLTHYIYNLDGKRKRLLMLNIILHFIENANLQLKQRLKGIILLMSHNSQSKPTEAKTIQRLFNHWKGSYNSTLVSHPSDSKTEPTKDNQYRYNPIPSLCNNVDQHTINSDYYDKLYHDHIIHSQKRDIRTIEANTIEGNMSTFTPVINKPTISDTNGNHLVKSKSLFHLRQKAFLKCKEKHIKDRSMYLETLEGNECKFLPTINNYTFKKPRTTNNSPAHLRLYTEANIRQQKFIRKQREEEEAIKNNSNHNKHISIDLNRIHFLYNEYKIKKITQDGLAKETDTDIGNTYKPYVTHDKYYHKVNTSFFEREHEYMQNKRIIKEIDENSFKMNRKQIQVGYQSYLLKNKKTICNEVVSRLFPKYEVKANKNKTMMALSNNNNFITSSTLAQSRNGVSHNSTNIHQIDVNK